MKTFQYLVKENISNDEYTLWKKFLKKKNKDYAEIEGLWRRTQDKKNKKDSGWKNSHDKRRKMLHYINRYTIKKKNNQNNLYLKETYLWISLAFPSNEMKGFLEQIEKGLKKGNWSKRGDLFFNNNLTFSMKNFGNSHTEDKKSNRTFPKDYEIVEITIKTKGMKIPKKIQAHPWEVLSTGIREKDKRKTPKIIKDPKEILKYLPAQVEVGCGPSIECNIPPLHALHAIYRITNPETKKFILSPEQDDLLYKILENQNKFFKNSTLAYKQIILAKPNKTYNSILKLHKKGYFVGDILTNNFDGIPKRLNLKERYLRRYDETHITPKIKFHKHAKSLIVIGSHADRRKVQRSARKQGLKIIYIDPEGYQTRKKWVKYPLESIQAKDILIPMEAKNFLPKLEAILSKIDNTKL